MKMITLLAALVAPALAYAQPSCGFRVDMAEALESNWGESLIASGISGPDRLLELWGNHDTGSWTVMIVHPSGMACMVDSGRALEVAPLGEPM